jgi:cystathionine gamma-lyase/homocysteine desulfhydrase
MQQETISVHGRLPRPHGNGPASTPIYQSATFQAESVAEQERLRTGDRFYTRYGNPTQSKAEEMVAALEGADAGLVFGSGMAAITSALLTTLQPGDHLLIQRELYGGTFEFVTKWLPRLHVDVTMFEAARAADCEQLLRPNTRAIYIESPTNPTLQLVDIRAITDCARRHGIRTMMDNTFASPFNQLPHALGVDVVVHSATKYLAGHSDLVCGAVTGRQDFINELHETRTTLGGIMDPLAAWLLIRGIKTLGVRMERHNGSAMAIAEYLSGHPAVRRVNYPFLSQHPQHALAKAQMRGGSGMISFELDADAAGAARFVESLRVFSLAGSLGGVESLATIPAATTHARLSGKERTAMGVSDGLIRLSVGIEAVEDLIADIDQALVNTARLRGIPEVVASRASTPAGERIRHDSAS